MWLERCRLRSDCAAPSGLITSPASTAETAFSTRTGSAGVDFDIDNEGQVSSAVLVAREMRNRRPFLALPDSADLGVADAGVQPAAFAANSITLRPRSSFEMLQSEGDGVDAGGGREIVHERLDGQDIGEGAKRAQGGDSHRHVREKVLYHPPAGKVIERYRIAIGATERLWEVDRVRGRHRRG